MVFFIQFKKKLTYTFGKISLTDNLLHRIIPLDYCMRLRIFDALTAHWVVPYNCAALSRQGILCSFCLRTPCCMHALIG